MTTAGASWPPGSTAEDRPRVIPARMSLMSGPRLSRRAVLRGLASLALGLALPARHAAANSLEPRTFDYRVDISMLFNLLRYSVGGSMVEDVDAQAGRYR